MLDYLHNDDLRWWLDRATEDLCADAKVRIRREIEAHCADAVEAHVADGLTPKEAERATLDGLGLPGPAAKAFRRAHLTKRQDEQLAWLAAPWRQPIRLFGMVHWVFPAAMAGLFNQARHSYLLALVALACWLLLVQCVVVPRLCRRGYCRRALLWFAANVLLTLNVALGFLSSIAPPELAPYWPFAWLFCVASFVAFIAFTVPIWRKLGGVPDCQGTPPNPRLGAPS